MVRRIAKLTVCILVAWRFLFGVGAYEILHFPQDTRSLSLHNAASAYDWPLLRNNPAALSLASEKTVYSYLILPAGIHSGEIQQVRRIGTVIYAGKLAYIDYGAIVDGNSTEKTTASDILLEIGYKKEFENIVSVGISGGLLISSISGYNSQLLYTNIGIRSRMMRKRIGFGVSLENVGFLLASYTDVKESIPAIFRSALYYRPKYLPAIISIDIVRNLDRDTAGLLGGVEFNPGKWLSFRLGCSSHRTGFLTDNFSSNLLADVSGGVGFQFNKMNLDVGFMNLGPAGYVVGFSLSSKGN
jgi:hypothetical protein